MSEKRPTTPVAKTAKQKTPVWVPATGSPKTRIKKARYYLKQKARVPTHAEDRLNALLVVTCNLRLYHQISIDLTLALVKEHYNSRCLEAAGYFWTDKDILTKYKQAGGVGMFPTLGVSDPKAKQKETVKALYQEVKRFLKKHIGQGGSCSPTHLREAFIAFRGGVDINPTAFGRAVFSVTGIRTITPFGKRVYRGFHILETGSGLAKKPENTAIAA